jgi:hypothetical protein
MCGGRLLHTATLLDPHQVFPALFIPRFDQSCDNALPVRPALSYLQGVSFQAVAALQPQKTEYGRVY